MSLTREDLTQIELLLDRKLESKFEEKLAPIYARLDSLEESLDGKIKMVVTELSAEFDEKLGRLIERVNDHEVELGKHRTDLRIIRRAVAGQIEYAAD